MKISRILVYFLAILHLFFGIVAVLSNQLHRPLSQLDSNSETKPEKNYARPDRRLCSIGSRK